MAMQLQLATEKLRPPTRFARDLELLTGRPEKIEERSIPSVPPPLTYIPSTFWKDRNHGTG